MPIHIWPRRHGIRVACTVIETLKQIAGVKNPVRTIPKDRHQRSITDSVGRVWRFICGEMRAKQTPTTYSGLQPAM
jgi:hypothetical protein